MARRRQRAKAAESGEILWVELQRPAEQPVRLRVPARVTVLAHLLQLCEREVVVCLRVAGWARTTAAYPSICWRVDTPVSGTSDSADAGCGPVCVTITVVWGRPGAIR